MNRIQELAYLYQRYKDETCTLAERQAFMALVRRPEMAAALKELIGKDSTGIDEGTILITKELSREKAEEIFQLIVATTSTQSAPFAVPAASMSAIPSAESVPSVAPAPSIAPVLPFTTKTQRRRWWSAAAAVLLLLLTGAGTIIFNHRSPMPVARLSLVKPPQNDALPGGNRAMLTLSNGSVIILDSAANGLLAEQGSAKISKLKTGQLAYEETGAGAGATGTGAAGAGGSVGAGAEGAAGSRGAGHAGVAGTGRAGASGPGGVSEKSVAGGSVSEKTVAVYYNTLSTPRGGQYQLVLPDGTKVWLNAASSITYPTSFTGAERRITMTGEAYFEVAKMLAPATTRKGLENDKDRVSTGKDSKNDKDHVFAENDGKGEEGRASAGHIPFIVVANGTEIEVLGTHFNINAYKEDPAVLTTLLEGSVKVSAHGNKQMIRPGEQAVVIPSGTGIGLNKDVDLEEVVAWKNGYFQFDHADIQTIMRQVARWYDVEISYEGKVPDRKFGGDISRDLKLTEVLYGLNLSKVHFRIEGKKLVILP